MRQRSLAIAHVLPAVLMLVLATTADAVPVARVDWSEHTPLSGTTVEGKLVLDVAEGGVYPLVVIDDPPLGGGDIVVTVDVAAGTLERPGFLELWAVYEDGGRYFSRSLDPSGNGVLRNGVSLTVELPFALSGTVPDSLELNAVLPAGGRLEIGPATLYELGSSHAPAHGDTRAAWWSRQSGALIGSGAGGALGVLGALIGVLASRGRARRFVIATMAAGTVVGVVALALGIIALAKGQPHHVWWPTLLLGVILTVVFGGLLRVVIVRYQALELERMRAHDLARSA